MKKELLEKIIKTSTIFILVAALFLSCQKRDATPGDEVVKEFNMAIFWLDSDIDPIHGWHGWALNRVGAGENLIQIDENLEFKPSLAESYEQPDSRTTVFHIRDNAYFHNGKKVDAQAAKESIERALNESDRLDVKFDVEHMIAEGQTLTIQTPEPHPTILNLLADTVFIIVDAQAAKDNPDFKYQPILTGAFKLVDFNKDTGMTLHRHDQHWRSQTNVEVVNVQYISDASIRAMALQSGELDFAPQINSNDLTLFADNPDFSIQKGPNLRVFTLRLNFEKPYMKELAFRQALAYGMDKTSYAQELVNGIPANGPFNSQLPFAYKGSDPYQYDPEKAKALLDELSYKDSDGDGIREYAGKNIVMRYVSMTNHGADARNIAVAMQQQYKEIGLGLDILQIENYRDIADKGEYDLLWERWTSAPTADCQYLIKSAFTSGSAGNNGKYSNPALDAISQKLDVTMDKSERDHLGEEASRILIEDIPSLFLYYQEGNVITSKKVTGVERFISEIYYIDDRIMLQ